MTKTTTFAVPESPTLAAYVERTKNSFALTEQAGAVLPGGSTRSHGWFDPYPLVVDHGEGSYLWDVDGNQYLDFTYNGLSVIHGYAYAPIESVIESIIHSGTAWVGTSRQQIAYAEYLCDRVPGADQVRFTNSGTEATMLATKLARHVTGRPIVLKSWGAYHGSYDDLEAGLYDKNELPGRTLLAQFGDLESYRSVFAEHGDQIAAVIIEPVQFTFRVLTPPEGFLAALTELAHEYGALVILDDCLMFRLAHGGSSERFGFQPDLTCLGKFIGGTLPMGVLAGRRGLMDALNPLQPDSLYHGGSFNGNPLACAAGLVGLKDLSKERIDSMNELGYMLRVGLAKLEKKHDFPLEISGDGSVIGVLAADDQGGINTPASAILNLAMVNRGVYYSADGNLGLCTAFRTDEIQMTLEAFDEAIKETKEWVDSH